MHQGMRCSARQAVCLVLHLLIWFCQASTEQNVDPAKVVRAVNERQIQEAIDAHAGKDGLLSIVVAGSIRLTRSIAVRQGTGPLKISGANAVSRSAEGSPQPSAALDSSRMKPSAPVLLVMNTAAVNISGLKLIGSKGSPAVLARQSGPLSFSDSVFTGSNNTGKYADPPNGGSITCISCEELVVEGCRFDNNAAQIGGAIFAVNAAKGIKVSGSWFIENQSGSEGGSVALANAAGEISNCTFLKSQTKLKTGWGGAISSHNTSLTVQDTLFEECASGESGSAMQSSLSNVTVNRINCINSASQWFGGCLFFVAGSRGVVTDSLFRNNSAVVAGGAIHVDRNGAVEVTNSAFENNTSPYGGAINGQEEGGFVKLRSCRFWNNSASDKGAAIHVENRRFLLDVQDTLFDSNQGGGVGGAIACTTSRCHLRNCTFTNNTASQLGGALWSSSSAGMEVNSSSIVGNKALRGGGMCVEAPDELLIYESELRDNTADVDGGGVLMVSVTNGTATVVRSPISNNTAAIGGGLMLISAANVLLRDTTVSNNNAKIDPNKPLVSTVEGSFSSAGSGGGIYGSQCGLRLMDSRLTGNTAAANGGGAALQLCRAAFEQSLVDSNQAAGGNGGGIFAALAGDRNLTADSTTFQNNSAVSGGAVFVSGPTNGVAVGHFSCSNCTLRANRAESQSASSEQGGGGVKATGNMDVELTRSTAEGNTATSGPGGALHCLQCNSLSLQDCRLHHNNASGPGGGACCEKCDHTSVRAVEAGSNRATAGGALYLALEPTAAAGEKKTSLGIFDSKFDRNTAAGTALTAAAAAPEGDGSGGGAAAIDQDDVSGAGGAVVVKSPSAFEVSGSSFTSNNAAAGHGGAVYHQACTGSADCKLSIRSSSFADNTADKGGGGAVFTTNGTLLSLPDDCSSSDGSGSGDSASSREVTSTPCENSSSFKSSRNQAAFGKDVASTPSRLGVASGSELAWLRQLDNGDQYASRRRLLAETVGGSSGATEQPKVLYLESNNRFNLEVRQKDHWGSNVMTDSAKPTDATIRLLDHGVPSRNAADKVAAGAKNGSLCAQSCEPGRPCIVGCLTGATTVAFKNGVANFSSVGLSAPANSSLKMQVLPGGLSGVPLVDVMVRVHTCGVGEYQNSQGSCEQCPAPQINLNPYKSKNCSSCPFGANCQAGFPTPLPGFWHSHPRSALFHTCPSQAACMPADNGKRLLAYQQLHKHDGIPGWLENRTAVGDEYLQVQCAPGRSGPLCSNCARGYGKGPGNVCRKCPGGGRAGAAVLYLLVRLVDVLLVTLLACVMLVAWSCGRECFAGSGLQLLDSHESINSATALRGSASQDVGDSADPGDGNGAASAGLKQLGQEGASEAEVLAAASRLAVWTLALLDWHQLAYLIFSAAAPLMARGASMLLSLLLTTPQSTLQWVPMECLVRQGAAGSATAASSVISSLYPVLLGLASFGVLCLLKPLARRCAGGQQPRQQQQQARPQQQALPQAPSTGSTAVNGDDVTHTSPFVTRAHQQAATAAAGGNVRGPSPYSQNSWRAGSTGHGARCGSRRQWLCAVKGVCYHLTDAFRQLGVPGLLIAAAVASLSYCTVDLAANAVSAFQCTPLDPVGVADMLPGERRGAEGSWWSRNLALRCYGPAQVTAAAVAGAVCLPLLLLSIAVIAAAIQAARYKRNTPTGQQLYDTWLSKLWGQGTPYQQCRVSERSNAGLLGPRWAEALSAVGFTFAAPFQAAGPAAWWALAALLFRIALAVLLTAVDSAVASSVLLRAVVASGAVACVQLLLAWVQPAIAPRDDRTLGGCYLLLQVLCVMTVAAEALQPVGPASRAVLYVLLVVIGSVYCLYSAVSALQSLCRAIL